MKVMLAATLENFKQVKFPQLCSVKLDGVRAIVLKKEGKIRVLSRNMKLIPNAHVQKTFGIKEMLGFDGELIVNPPNSDDVFRRTSSAVMSYDGKPDVMFYVFDIYDVKHQKVPYVGRYAKIQEVMDKFKLGFRNVSTVVQTPATTEEEVEHYYSESTQYGFEGLMLRSPLGPYKCGRSTINEGYLVKLKRFSDGEAEVIGWEEMMHNDNEGVRNELTGRLERSSHQANKRPAGVLGKLLVRDLKTKVEFHVGGGFSAEERKLLFIHPPSLMWRVLKYKYFPSGGKDKPRFPVFLGWRDPRDL